MRGGEGWCREPLLGHGETLVEVQRPGDGEGVVETAQRGEGRNAAAEVCRATPGADGTDIGAILVYDDCFRESVQRAVTQLNAPLVTAAFDAKSARQKLARLP
jgi:hypothetical protein